MRWMELHMWGTHPSHSLPEVHVRIAIGKDIRGKDVRQELRNLSGN